MIISFNNKLNDTFIYFFNKKILPNNIPKTTKCYFKFEKKLAALEIYQNGDVFFHKCKQKLIDLKNMLNSVEIKRLPVKCNPQTFSCGSRTFFAGWEGTGRHNIFFTGAFFTSHTVNHRLHERVCTNLVHVMGQKVTHVCVFLNPSG